MEADPGETNNLYASQPEVVERLLSRMTSDVLRGRSTKGLPAANDVEEIVLWKTEEKAEGSDGGKKKVKEAKEGKK